MEQVKKNNVNEAIWEIQMQDGWTSCRLKELCEFRNGYTPSKQEPAFWENGTIPWYRMEDIRKSGRKLDKAIQQITEIAVKGGGLFSAGSFILATTATIGEHALLIADSLANQRFTNLMIRESLQSVVSKEFMFYHLFVIDEFCHYASRETTFSAVNMEDLRQYKFPIPPFTEQERIVEYLDAKCGDIDNRIAVLEKELKAYERLKVAVINRAVTEGLDPKTPKRDSGLDWLGMIPEHWKVMRLKDVSELNPRYVGKDIRDDVEFLPMEGLRHDIITTQQIDFEEGRKKYTHFGNGDLLIAKVTPCFENWNIAIATELQYGVGFGSSEFFVLRTNDKCLNRFLFYLVCVEPFQGKACETMCGVGGLKRISPLFMRTQHIGLPPLSEQKAIVEYLDTKCAAIDAKIGNIAKRIEAYKRLKRALINEVVTGKRAV